ncbi:MAG: SBBP repeat-containing protein, partial [Acidobacteria bacterium]|nr:SBBP repeat-containing protein [Acidobacteriota bacterium]
DIDTDGNLVVNTDFGNLIHKKPVSYQILNGEKVKISVNFKKIGKFSYSFEVGEYDTNLELIIDPLVVDYSTYLGGTGHDYSYCIAVDSSGAAYIAGYTGSTNYPTQNQYQSSQNASDAFVTKHSPTGNTLEYSTYLGGNNGEYGYGIAVDSTGSAYITGQTYSTNFPTLNPYQTFQGNYDCFVTKLTPAGNALVYSTYIGGSSSDQAYAIAIDSSGAAYITGTTYSTNYPSVNQYQIDQADYDAFVSKLSPAGNTLLYSTYLGGSGRDYGYGIDVDSSGAAYVTGHTNSSNFPLVNHYQAYQGSYDAFVTKLSPTGNTLSYSTYLGGSSADYGRAIAINSSGSAYITGYTYSTNYPCLNGYQLTNHGNADVFVTRLSSAGDSLLYSTYIGGSAGDEGHGIAFDNTGSIYVAGSTYSSDFPVENQYQDDQGNWDFFVTQFDPTGSSLIFSTYIGGTMGDYCNAMALDSSRNIYLAGYSGSTDFPVINEYQTHQGNNDAAMVALQWYIPNNAPVAVIDADLFGGVAPVTITFDGSNSYDSDGSVVAWRWSFGDGSTGTGEIITHEYTTSGKFTASLHVKDNDDRWSAVASKQIIVFIAGEISCDLKISPQSIKANGREVAQVSTTLYQNYSDGSAPTPILYDLKLNFYTTNGLILGINQFDSTTGKYSDTLISGDPGQAIVVAKLGETEMCSAQINYTWPRSPVGLKAEIRKDRSLMKAVLYIDLSWQENPDDIYSTSGFKIYRSTNGYEWETLSEVAPGIFGYTDKAVPVSNEYIYAVSKIDTDGDESEKAIFDI